MVEAEAYQKNYIINHQSDIFNQKNLERKEIPYSQKAHNPNGSNKTSFDFLTWNEINNNNYTIPTKGKKYKFNLIKPIKKSKNFSEKLYSVDDSSIKTSNNKRQKETLFMGNYEGNEYKIKKDKSKEYNPDLYYKRKKPAEIKIEQIYGNVKRRNKPAIHRTKTEDKNYNTISNFLLEKRNQLFFRRKKIDNSKSKLDSLSFNNSTNNVYNPNITPIENRVNMLKSNIFNQKRIEKMNTEISFKKNEEPQIKVKLKEKKHSRRAKFENDGEKFPNNLDWRDAKTNLLFNSEKDIEIIKRNARQRKFKEIYGTEPSKPKEKTEDNFKINDRKIIEQETKNMYSGLNQDKIKRISENISQIQGNEFISNSCRFKGKNVNNREIKSFEINNSKINGKEIEKAFADKGIHIYDIKEEKTLVLGNIKDNKIVFKIRENKNDNDFDNKIKDIKNEFKTNKNIDIKSSSQHPKKKNADLLPSTLKWNNIKSEIYTKNKNVEKTLQEKTHSKPIINNNEEKMTKIFVNLRYKNKFNLPKYI